MPTGLSFPPSRQGGFSFLGTYGDLMATPEGNKVAADYARSEMRKRVADPAVAQMLLPNDHPVGVKRLCLDTGYLEVFNQPKTRLIDVRKTPIERISRTGVVAGGVNYEADCIVFATGFDAMTGSILAVDIKGRGGESLRDKWAAGPRTYLGLSTAGFPNLFFITGPGSPSVLSNMIISIEQHVHWIADCISNLEGRQVRAIEATSSEASSVEMATYFATEPKPGQQSVKGRSLSTVFGTPMQVMG